MHLLETRRNYCFNAGYVYILPRFHRDQVGPALRSSPGSIGTLQSIKFASELELVSALRLHCPRSQAFQLRSQRLFHKQIRSLPDVLDSPCTNRRCHSSLISPARFSQAREVRLRHLLSPDRADKLTAVPYPHLVSVRQPGSCDSDSAVKPSSNVVRTTAICIYWKNSLVPSKTSLESIVTQFGLVPCGTLAQTHTILRT